MWWEIAAEIVKTVGLGVVLPAAGIWINQHLRNASMRTALVGAAKSGAGIAYDYLASRSAGMDPDSARRNAFSMGVAYINKTAADAVQHFAGQVDVEGLLRAKIGDLLAVDPTVSVADKLPTPLPAVTALGTKPQT